MTRPLGRTAAWWSIGAVLVFIAGVVAITYVAEQPDTQGASNVTRMAEHRPPLKW